MSKFFRVFFMMAPDGDGAGAGGGGGGAAPSGSSSASTPTPQAPASGSGDNGSPSQAAPSSPLPFMEIPDLGDLDGVVIEAPGAKAPVAPAADGTVVVPPGTTPQAPAQAAPAQPGAQPPQVQPQGGAAAPPAPQPAAAAIPAPLPMSQQLTASMAVLIPQIAESEGFRLNEEDIAELDTNPVAALQKAQARTYMHAMRYFHTHLETELPKLIQAGVAEGIANQTRATETRTRVTAMLKSAYPAIDTNNPEHVQALTMLTGAYRTANPQATLEQVIQDVGMLVTQRLKLSAAPAAPAPPKSAPMFVPANGGTQNGTSGTPPPDNPFAGMADHFES